MIISEGVEARLQEVLAWLERRQKVKMEHEAGLPHRQQDDISIYDTHSVRGQKIQDVIQ